MERPNPFGVRLRHVERDVSRPKTATTECMAQVSPGERDRHDDPGREEEPCQNCRIPQRSL